MPELPTRAIGILAIACALLARGTLPTRGEDRIDAGWPHIRGPTWDGHSPETGLVDGWGEKGPPVLWVRELGQGYSAFVGFGDRVWTLRQTLAGQFAICLNSETGETVWERKIDWPFEAAGVYPGPRATPTYAEGRIVYSAPSGLTGCLDSSTGRPHWSVNVKEQFGGQGTDFGYSCSPTIVGRLVFLPVGGRGASMVALSLDDGSVVWKSGDAPASYTPAMPITVDGRDCVLGYLENALACFDRSDGQLLWSRHLSQGYDEHSAWPLWSEPHLWISGPFRGGSSLLKLTGGETPSSQIVRHSPLLSNDIFSSVLLDGSVYGFDLKDVQAKTQRPSRGVFRCVDFLTGEPKWETDRTGHCTVMVADGKLILLNDTGELVLARASSERYEEMARIPVLSGELCWTQPCLHQGRLYVRNQTRAACLDLCRPEVRPVANSSEDPTSPPALTVADIPQTPYRDWASILLPVEPEYAFDVPTLDLMTCWFWLCLILLMGPALAAAALVAASVRLLRGRWPSPRANRTVWWTVAAGLGLVGTTMLSQRTGEFLFTWPLSIYAAFAVAISASYRAGAEKTPASRRLSYAAAVVFLAAGAAYFLVCRRLSLVFEWTFLFGFPAALPIAWLAERFSPCGRLQWLWHLILGAAGFSASYWASVGLLASKS